MTHREAKTWKREVAMTLLGFWMFVTTAVFVFGLFGGAITVLGALSAFYGITTTAIFGFAGAAFSMDAWAKQVVPAQERMRAIATKQEHT